MTKNTIYIEDKDAASVAELNSVIEHIKLYPGFETYILDFAEPIKKIDIVFLGGLVLLHKKHGTKFSVVCDYSPDKQGKIEYVLFPIRQNMKHIETLYQIKFSDLFKNFTSIIKLNDSDLVASESYTPVLFVDDQTINDFFRFNDELCQNHHITHLKTDYISNKILPKTKANKRTQEFFAENVQILNSLKEKPAIFTFVFTIVYNKLNPFVTKRGNKALTKDERFDRMDQLWSFTQEYVLGLYELAKNIVLHSSDKYGIITIRAYEGTGQMNDLTPRKALETHVFDFGNTGIIDTLIESTKTNANEPDGDINRIFKDDQKILLATENKFSLQDFIVPEPTKILNQQIYRELAHYGIMKFSKLIKSNKGSFCASTNQISENQTILGQDIYLSDKSVSGKNIKSGTSYYFELPFHSELYKTDTSTKISNISSPQTLESLSRLLDFKLVKIDDFDADSIQELTKNHIVNFELNERCINRADEKKILSKFEILKKIQSTKIYVSINVDSRFISDASSLLRILSQLGLEYEHNFILYNVKFELLEQLIKDNEMYYHFLSKSDTEFIAIPYWFSDKAILIYSHVDRFSFADILVGESSDEFENVNSIISNTFPNSTSIIKPKIYRSGASFANAASPFFHQTSLFPFDVLIGFNEQTDPSGYKSVFQFNLEKILNTELDVSNSLQDE